jgi:tetratricopeptide (TPR) repeat protein
MRRSLVALSVCAAASLFAGAARADDAAAAARHFDAGTALYRAGKFREAEAEFQQAWDAHHTFDVAANLGDCEVEIGQYREAAEHLAYGLKELPISVKEAVRERLQARFALARAEVAAVRVHVTPAQATVIVNGREFAPVPEEVFVDPGAAAVEARLPGYNAAKAETQPLRKGASEDVTLTLTPLPAQVVEAESHKSVALIVAGAGVTAAGLVTGLAFTLLAASKASSADATLRSIEADHGGDPSPCSAVPADARCGSLKQTNADSDTMTRVGLAAFIVGGVAGAATLTYVLWPSKPAAQQAGKLRLTPALSPGYGGASLRLSF